MDTTKINQQFTDNWWSIYVIALAVFIVMFFVYRYSYLIDKQINRMESQNGKWTGKPWPLLSGLLIGLVAFLFGVFLPDKLEISPAKWNWPEIVIAIFAGVVITRLLIESFQHFGRKYAIIRFFIWLTLSAGYCVAGFLMGFIIATLLAFSVIIYFIFFWKKKLTIK